MTRATGKSIRNRWPKGIAGSLRYFTDHVLYRHTRPVDWTALQAVENGMMHGHVIFGGGFFVLTDDEADVFRALGKYGDVEQARAELNMSEERIKRYLELITGKSGALSISELVQLAEQHSR